MVPPTGFSLGTSVTLLLVSLPAPVVGVTGATGVELLTLEGMHLTTGILAVVTVGLAARPTWNWGQPGYPERVVEAREALVTGVTGGIGAEVALALVAKGFRVVGMGRSIEKARVLENRARGQPGQLTVLTGDMARLQGVCPPCEESERTGERKIHGGRSLRGYAQATVAGHG